MASERVVRRLNTGTFIVLTVIGLLVMTSNLMATWAIVYITTQTERTPTAILGALAMNGLQNLLLLGDKVFKWTRGIDDDDSS